MQKLLYVAGELHLRGFENVRVLPFLSPSGCHWRCYFFVVTGSVINEMIATNWIQEIVNIEEKIQFSVKELTDIFEKDNPLFLADCKGENKEYIEWFSNVLLLLKEGELPVAFSDYSSFKGFWNISEGNKIATLPNEKYYYSSLHK